MGRDEARRLGDVLTETRCLVYRTIVRRKLCDVDGVRALVAAAARLDERQQPLPGDVRAALEAALEQPTAGALRRSRRARARRRHA